MNPKGWIAINGVAHKRMDLPEAVHLLYDAVNHRIGLKPTSRAMKHSFPLLHNGSARRGRRVAALKLVREVGIVVRETIEFRNIEIDQDGIMILDLRDTRVSMRSRGIIKSLQRRGKWVPPRGEGVQ